MLKNQRHQVILRKLTDEGAVQVTDLAELLDVDPVTIRRDLAEMETQHRIRRVHGGAVLREGEESRREHIRPDPTYRGGRGEGHIPMGACSFWAPAH